MPETAPDAIMDDVPRFTVRDATGAVVARGEGGRAEAEAAIFAADLDIIPVFPDTLPNEKKRRELHNAEILKKYKINC